VLDLGLEIKWEWRLKYETGLLLEGNPLKSPPPLIVQKGTQAVREYFKPKPSAAVPRSWWSSIKWMKTPGSR
jgi:hypothetical protein